MEEWTSRTVSLIGDHSSLFEDKMIAVAGLGGTGAYAFMALVRLGVRNFKLADFASFDEPDMNRQLAAFGHTMGKRKLDVYAELARSINPHVTLELHHEGLTVDNVASFLSDSDIYLRAFDIEADLEVERVTDGIIATSETAFFSSCTVGFGAIAFNYRRGMIPYGKVIETLRSQASNDAEGDTYIPSLVETWFPGSSVGNLRQGYQQRGKVPSCSLGANLGGLVMASHVTNHILDGTDLVQTPVVWSPEFLTIDLVHGVHEVRNVTDILQGNVT